jgi:hypothetical protein
MCGNVACRTQLPAVDLTTKGDVARIRTVGRDKPRSVAKSVTVE